MIRKLIVLMFFVLVACMAHQNELLKLSGNGIISLEFAGANLGNQILSSYRSSPYGDTTLLEVARNNLYLDFLYIVIYVWLMLMLSNAQMQREKWPPLNELLRLNLLLAIIIGGLDITENLRLLHNLHHIGMPGNYWGTYWLTLPKFILAGWVVLVWLVSVIKGGILRRAY